MLRLPFRARFFVALGSPRSPFLIYPLAIQIQKQVVLPRFLGLLEVAAIALAVLAAAAVSLPVGRAWRAGARPSSRA